MTFQAIAFPSGKANSVYQCHLLSFFTEFECLVLPPTKTYVLLVEDQRNQTKRYALHPRVQCYAFQFPPNSTALLLEFDRCYRYTAPQDSSEQNLDFSLRELLPGSPWSANYKDSLVTLLAKGAANKKAIQPLLQRIVETVKPLSLVVQQTIDILEHQAGTPVLQCGEILGYSNRHIARLFRKEIGITTKQYQQLVRLRKAVDRLKTRQFVKLSDIAYDLGFSDQAHFCRSIRAFTSYSPRHLLAGTESVLFLKAFQNDNGMLSLNRG